MITMLPDSAFSGNNELLLNCYHSALQVWIDEVLLYEYAMDRLEAHKFAGSGCHIVSLPSDFSGKELRVCYYPTEYDVLTSFDIPAIYPANTAIKALYAKQGIFCFIGLFLMLFGLLLQIVSAFLTFKIPSALRIYFVGLFAFLVGLWSTCYFDFWQLFNLPVYFISTLENFTLFWTAVPIMLYFYRDVQYTRQRGILIFYRILLVLEIAFAAIACILHFSDLIHFKKLLSLLHVFQLAAVLSIFYCVMKNFRRRHSADRIQMIGICLAGAGVLLDVIVYDIIVLLTGNPTSMLAFTAIGTLGFVLFLLIAFVMETLITLTKKAENEVLKKYAYTDELTDIGNRHACEEKLRQVEEIDDANYGIISIDLNDLKITNDSHGHEVGDHLLKTFAELLKEYFEKFGFIGRMGGDEFLIVIDDARAFSYDKHLTRFQQRLEEYSHRCNNFQLTAAFGYAAASEWKECSAHEVYHTADTRMYEFKRKQKEHLA
ncbi:MAG: diguanylate cyclase [Lachnospiraceae bacterium]|nr:diguanylate cyclase [Lachnospiraceae bacterium]